MGRHETKESFIRPLQKRLLMWANHQQRQLLQMQVIIKTKILTYIESYGEADRQEPERTLPFTSFLFDLNYVKLHSDSHHTQPHF